MRFQAPRSSPQAIINTIHHGASHWRSHGRKEDATAGTQFSLKNDARSITDASFLPRGFDQGLAQHRQALGAKAPR